MKLLMIANSFAQNLQTYSHQIANANGLDLDIFVLYIGGCTLEQHCNNLKPEGDKYQLQMNGRITGEMISIDEALELFNWDMISLQQGSHRSPVIESYYPYFENLYNHVHEMCPNAKIIFHKTWAYSTLNPTHFNQVKNLDSIFNCNNQIEMKNKIDECCNKICKEFDIDFVINSGDVVEIAAKNNIDPYEIDGFHMGKIGCYLIGLNLVKKLLNKKIESIYIPEGFDENCCKKYTDFINKNL